MAHRVKIGARVQSILGQFWQDNETPDAVRALEIESWCDVLENCSHTEIRKAWAEYQKTGPRSKARRLARPDAGALYDLILRARPKPKLVYTPEETRAPTSQESKDRVADMVKNAGYGLRMP